MLGGSADDEKGITCEMNPRLKHSQLILATQTRKRNVERRAAQGEEGLAALKAQED